VIVLDASALIALLDSRDAHHTSAREVLGAHVEEDLALSVLTLAEVLVGPTVAGVAGAVRAAVDDLEIRTLPLPADQASRLAELRVATRLAMPDCCVLLAALDTQAQLVTFDARLAAAATAAGVTTLR
jgi:predicted nucleic acid-binding protein